MAKKVKIRGISGTVRQSTRKGKKWMFVPDNPNYKTVHAGQKGAKIRPGTEAGNSYCARSANIPRKKGQKVSPNDLARKAWNCKGKRSVGKKSSIS